MGRELSSPIRRLSAGDERGFTLIEVMVATIIAILAVTALATSFGVGRGLIDRFETGRDALALVQLRLERLAALNPSHADLAIGVHDAGAVPINDVVTGNETWTVIWVDDPVDGSGGTDSTGPNDYKRVTVAITWTQGGFSDAMQLSRIFLLPSP